MRFPHIQASVIPVVATPVRKICGNSVDCILLQREEVHGSRKRLRVGHGRMPETETQNLNSGHMVPVEKADKFMLAGEVQIRGLGTVFANLSWWSFRSHVLQRRFFMLIHDNWSSTRACDLSQVSYQDLEDSERISSGGSRPLIRFLL